MTKPVEPSINSAFIIGSGQMGSQFLASFFKNTCPDVYAVHEPTPSLLMAGINLWRSEPESIAEVDKIIKSRRNLIQTAKACQRSIYLESNGMIWLLLDQFIKEFPGSRYIHVVREPRDYLVSAFNRSLDHMKGRYYYDEIDEDFFLKPADLNDTEHKQYWKDYSRFERICWYWTASNRHIHETMQHRADYLMIHFEDLFGSSNKDTLDRMFDFLQVSPSAGELEIKAYFDHKIHMTDRTLLKRYEDIPSKIQSSIGKITNETAKIYGY